MIQQVNKSLINPACLLITLAFRHKETLCIINHLATTVLAVTLVHVTINPFRH